MLKVLREITEAPLPPTRGQDLIINTVRRFGFGNGAARIYGARAVSRLRGGPVDFDYHGLVVRHDPMRCGSARHMMFTPDWTDWREQRFLLENLPENGTFLDIGANAGFFTFLAAGEPRSARIVAFEPLDDLAETLRGNVDRNGLAQVSIDDRGLSDVEGMSDVEGRLTPTTTLARAVEEYGLRQVDVLKIDVEGMEDKVLLPFFANAPRRFWPRAMLVEHIFANDCIAFAKQHGYRELWRNHFNCALLLD